MSIASFPEGSPVQYNPFPAQARLADTPIVYDQAIQQIRTAVDPAVSKYFAEFMAPHVAGTLSLKERATQLAKQDHTPLLSQASAIITQVKKQFNINHKLNIEEKKQGELTNYCLEIPIEFIGRIGNPNLLHECEKIRREQMLHDIHIGFLRRWENFLSLAGLEQARQLTIYSVEHLQKFWLSWLPRNYHQAFKDDFLCQEHFIDNLEQQLEQAWGNVCRHRNIDLLDRSYYRSYKELFCTHLLEKCWNDTDGDLSNVSPADMVLLIENKDLIKKAHLEVSATLSDDLFASMTKIFDQIEELSLEQGGSTSDRLGTKGAEAIASLEHLSTLKLYRIGLKFLQQLFNQLHNCSKLKSLHLEQLPLNANDMHFIGQLRLSSLSLVGGKYDPQAFKKNLIPSKNTSHGLGNLKSLELRDNIGYGPKAISPEDAIELAIANPLLSELALISSTISDKHLQRLSESTGNLHFLDLSQCSQMGRGAVNLIKANPNLKVLIIHHDQALIAHTSNLAKATHNLMSFDIRYLEDTPIMLAENNPSLLAATYYADDLNDSLLKNFASKAPRLRSLTITVSPALSHQGLKDLATSCPRLKFAGFVANRGFDWQKLRSFTCQAQALEALSIEIFRQLPPLDLLKEIIADIPKLRWFNIFPYDEELVASLSDINSRLTVTSYPHKQWVSTTVIQRDD
ncbi:MAG: hypothetical protein ACQEP8_04255 [Chlamydiota bacterium]